MKKLLLGLLFCGIAGLVGCGPTATPSPTPMPLSGRITFAGSTTVQPLAASIGQEFNKLYPDVVLDIAAGGSSVGIQAIHDGTVDIGMASRELKESEKQDINVYQIAADVIAIVVNKANPVNDLTSDQLRGIYFGEVTNWSEVGGPDMPITVVIREASSGTRKAFDELVLGGKEPTAPNIQKAITAGDVAAMVASTDSAIGYVGFGNLEETLHPIAIDGHMPTEENAKAGTYSLTRPLLLMTGPLTHPLAQYYLDFALSPAGQRIVADHGWLPIR